MPSDLSWVFWGRRNARAAEPECDEHRIAFEWAGVELLNANDGEEEPPLRGKVTLPGSRGRVAWRHIEWLSIDEEATPR